LPELARTADAGDGVRAPTCAVAAPERATGLAASMLPFEKEDDAGAASATQNIFAV